MILTTSILKLKQLYFLMEEIKYEFMSFVDNGLYGSYHGDLTQEKLAHEYIQFALKEFDFEQKAIEKVDKYLSEIQSKNCDQDVENETVQNLKPWLLNECKQEVIEFYKIRTVSEIWIAKIKASKDDWAILKEYNELIYEEYMLTLYNTKISTFSIDQQFRDIATKSRFDLYHEILEKNGLKKSDDYFIEVSEYLDDAVMHELDFENGFLEKITN